MAGIAYVRKRLYNPEVLVDPDEILGHNGKFLKMEGPDKTLETMYEIKWTGATQAGEELGTAVTSAKDGRTTPYLITVVSSNVADKRSTAAGAVHSVALIGVSVDSSELNGDGTLASWANPKTTVEVVHMDGTTDVLATRYWIWFDAMYACEWGTGANDATGNITGESPANTTLIALIIGQNEGEGGTWHFPANKEVHTQHVSITPTATFAAGDGVVLTGAYTGFEQENNTDPDLNVDYYTYTSAGGSVSEGGNLDLIHRHTTLNSKVLWLETTIANSIVYSLHIVQSIH